VPLLQYAKQRGFNPERKDTVLVAPTHLLCVNGDLLEDEGEDALGAGQQQVVLRQQRLRDTERLLSVLPRILKLTNSLISVQRNKDDQSRSPSLGR